MRTGSSAAHISVDITVPPSLGIEERRLKQLIRDRVPTGAWHSSDVIVKGENGWFLAPFLQGTLTPPWMMASRPRKLAWLYTVQTSSASARSMH